MDAMLASEHPWLKAYFRGKRSRAGHVAEAAAQARIAP
jgi:ABC-type transporter Mla maintaining outer membrane lipid asymmetry ATPase subunit MlaF